MAKRRANGEGNIRKRKDGRWEGRIVVGHKSNGDECDSARTVWYDFFYSELTTGTRWGKICGLKCDASIVLRQPLPGFIRMEISAASEPAYSLRQAEDDWA